LTVDPSQLPDKFAIDFVPEHWPPSRKFRKLLGPPFPTTTGMLIGLDTILSNINKYETLASLANRLAPQLAEDAAELKRDGFTPALRSKEFAALTETLICTLYSALDGLRNALYEIYRGVRFVQKKSTNDILVNAKESKYGPGFPEEIRLPLATAYSAWFVRLRPLRVAITHGVPGFCHLDEENKRIAYFSGQGRGHINDVVSELNEIYLAAHALIEEIFGFLCTKLEPQPLQLICGTYKARFYQREVVTSPNLTWASGRCLSKEWFEKEPGLECPLRDRCPAYTSTSAAQHTTAS